MHRPWPGLLICHNYENLILVFVSTFLSTHCKFSSLEIVFCCWINCQSSGTVQLCGAKEFHVILFSIRSTRTYVGVAVSHFLMLSCCCLQFLIGGFVVAGKRLEAD